MGVFDWFNDRKGKNPYASTYSSEWTDVKPDPYYSLDNQQRRQASAAYDQKIATADSAQKKMIADSAEKAKAQKWVPFSGPKRKGSGPLNGPKDY